MAYRAPNRRRKAGQSVASAGDYSNGCRGKVCHTSKKLASGVLRHMIAKQIVVDSSKLAPYKCKNCGHWHLGNSRHNHA